jgi:hypothetical protein
MRKSRAKFDRAVKGKSAAPQSAPRFQYHLPCDVKVFICPTPSPTHGNGDFQSSPRRPTVSSSPSVMSKFPRRRLDDDEKRKPTKSCDDATDRSPKIRQRLTTSSRCGTRSKAALHGVILSSSTSQRHVKLHAQLMPSKLQKKKQQLETTTKAVGSEECDERG